MNYPFSGFVVPQFGSPLFFGGSCPITNDLIGYLEAKTQAPRPLILLSILASYSTLAQGLIDVERPGVGVGPVSLFTLGIAESGERKSAISSYLDRPIVAFQERELLKYADDMLRYDLEVDLHESQKRGLTSLVTKKLAEGDSADDVKEQLFALLKQKPQKPIDPKLLYEDATPESMAESLHLGFGMASLASGEGGSILNGRIMQNMAMLNKLWAGESWSVSRKTTKSFVLANCRLSISILSQPNMFASFLQNTSSESRGIGFLARFLVSYPVSTQGTRFFNNRGCPDEIAYTRYLGRANQMLDSLKVSRIADRFGRKAMTFTPSAAGLWIWLYDFIESNLGVGGRFCNAKDHGAKLADNIARIAALLTYVEHGDEGVIDVEILKDAARVAFFFSDTFLLSVCQPPDWFLDDGALREFLQAKREDGLRYVRKNDVRKSGPYRLRSKVLLDASLQRLWSNGEINMLQNATGRLVIDLYPRVPFNYEQWRIVAE